MFVFRKFHDRYVALMTLWTDYFSPIWHAGKRIWTGSCRNHVHSAVEILWELVGASQDRGHNVAIPNSKHKIMWTRECGECTRVVRRMRSPVRCVWCSLFVHTGMWASIPCIVFCQMGWDWEGMCQSVLWEEYSRVRTIIACACRFVVIPTHDMSILWRSCIFFWLQNY